MSPTTSPWTRRLGAVRLLLAGRVLLAAQELGADPVRLERASRVAGQQGSPAKRAARLGLYLAFRLGRQVPGGAWFAATARRVAPRIHNAALKRYVAYSSTAGDWQPIARDRHALPGAHEAAVLRRMSRMIGPAR